MMLETTSAVVAHCCSVSGSAGQLWTLSAAAVIAAAVAAADCSTAACTAHNADPAVAESTPLAAPLTHIN